MIPSELFVVVVVEVLVVRHRGEKGRLVSDLGQLRVGRGQQALDALFRHCPSVFGSHYIIMYRQTQSRIRRRASAESCAIHTTLLRWLARLHSSRTYLSDLLAADGGCCWGPPLSHVIPLSCAYLSQRGKQLSVTAFPSSL